MPRPDVPAERESGGPARTGRPRRRPRRTAGGPHLADRFGTAREPRAPVRCPTGLRQTAGPRPDAARRSASGGPAQPGGRDPARRASARRTGHRGPRGRAPAPAIDRRPADDGPTPTFTDATGEVAALAERLPALTLADEHRIARRLATAARTRDGQARETALAAVAAAVDTAEQRRRRPPRRPPRDLLPGRAPRQRAPRRHRRRHPRPPGRDRRGRDRLREDHPDPQDLPRAGPRRRAG